MRTRLSFGLLIPGNRDFFVNRGAEQVSRPESQNEAQGKLPEIKRLHDLPVFWRNRACNGAEEAASGSNLTFESWKGFPSGSLHASLAHANRNFHFSQAC